MLLNILYLILAIFSLGFLIFIHELGHFWMARKVGIVVQTFSIGLGKPFLKWKRKGVTLSLQKSVRILDENIRKVKSVQPPNTFEFIPYMAIADYIRKV